MSTFFKAKVYLFLFLIMSFFMADAHSIEYNPATVDSVLTNNVMAAQLEEQIKLLGYDYIVRNPQWDIQQRKGHGALSSLPLSLFLIVMIIVIIKVFYKEFYDSILTGIVNVRVFQLDYNNKKYSKTIPLILQFVLKTALITFIGQYIIYIYTGRSSFMELKYFMGGVLLILTLFSVIYLAEFIVLKAIGIGSFFRIYFSQYNLITTWTWLPLFIFSYIFYLNDIRISFSTLSMISIVSALLFSILGASRSIIISNGVLRNHLIYYFMYLCTFKILPYLLILKFVEGIWG